MEAEELLKRLLNHFHMVYDVHDGKQQMYLGDSLVWTYSDNKDMLVELDFDLNKDLLAYLDARSN